VTELPTKPAEPQTFTALSDGALIGNQRYRVLEVVHRSKQLNRYRVEDQEPLIICPQCGTANPADSNFCQECRSSIQDVASFKPQYLLKEASQADRLSTEYALVQLELTHAKIIPPHAAFDEQVDGVERYYVVLDDPTWGTAAQIVPPHEASQVLAWGIGLAEGLNYLHQQRVVMNTLRGTEIALLGKEAKWADFEMAHVMPYEEWTQAGTQSTGNDVRQLAALIYRLATGLTQYDPNNRILSPKANAIFGRTLAETAYLTAGGLAEALREAEQNVRRPGGIDVSVARLSDVGQERDLDEDSILTLELGQVYRSVSTPLGVYVVADGMGGHEGGDVASRLAIHAIARLALSNIFTPAIMDATMPIDIENWIKQATLEANKVVLDQRKALRNDMGTTLVMAVVLNDLAYIAHVGDSRAYLIRNDEIQQLTVDHSLVERLIATNQITREEAATHRQRNVIYKNIGDKPQVEPDIMRLNLMPGDKLLLCCDGLSGEINDDEIKRIVIQYPALPVACRELIQAANVAGGHDNISVVLIEVVAIA
jgi:protein phosphatase